jgi:hypothetical protein
MPQIWVSYDELGEMLGATADQARATAVDAGWSRRRSRDGVSRVRLPPKMAHEFILAYATSAVQVDHDRMVAALRHVLSLGANSAATPPPSRCLTLAGMPRSR